MKIVQRFERKLRGAVDDAFARVFKGSVVPQEVEAALRSAASADVQTIDGGHQLVPNSYVVTLNNSDFERLANDRDLTERTFVRHLEDFIRDNGWQTYGPVRVQFAATEQLHTGQFRAQGQVNPDIPPASAQVDPGMYGAPPAAADYSAPAQQYAPPAQPYEPVQAYEAAPQYQQAPQYEAAQYGAAQEAQQYAAPPQYAAPAQPEEYRGYPPGYGQPAYSQSPGDIAPEQTFNQGAWDAPPAGAAGGAYSPQPEHGYAPQQGYPGGYPAQAYSGAGYAEPAYAPSGYTAQGYQATADPQAAGLDYTGPGAQLTATVYLSDDSGRSFTLREGSNIVGRGQEAAFRLADTGVSRKHLDIHWDGSLAILQDLGSTNGTSVNGSPVGQEWQLADGDQIRLGHSVLSIRIG